LIFRRGYVGNYRLSSLGAVLNPQLSTPIVTAATPRDILMVLKGVKVLFIIDLAVSVKALKGFEVLSAFLMSVR
jgi:hypothetical protein